MERVRADQIRMVYECSSLALITVFVNATILAVTHWTVIDRTFIVCWLAAVCVLSVGRVWLAMRFRSVQPGAAEMAFWARAASVAAALSGITWGVASYWLFAEQSLAHQMFLTFVIAGMAAGAVTTLSAQRCCAIAFVFAATLPLALRYAQADHEFAPTMSLMIVISACMLVPVANRYYRNITQMLIERYQREQTLQRDHMRSQVLERLAAGSPLPQILEAIVGGIEQNNPQVRGSILLSDEQGKHLLSGAAPNLPEFYNAAVHGLKIEASAGSCGTAAYRRERVIVEDIQSHPYWAPFRDIAAQAGLGACWSEPICSSSGGLLGTIAVYHSRSYTPTDHDLAELEHAANLAGIAIERSQSQEALKLAAMVYENTSEAMMITDERNRIVAVNPAFTDITGYGFDELIGTTPKRLASGQHDAVFYRRMWQTLKTTGQWQGEIWNRRKNGDEYAEWLTINTIFDTAGNPYRRVALFSDITEKKKSEALIWSQANYDNLTKLPNRRLFTEHLDHSLRTAQRTGRRLALLFIDLDHFKEVNDTLGHQLGDALLVETARRITHCVRSSDIVARLGGDEFTAILQDVDGTAAIDAVVRRLLTALSDPYQLGEDQAFVSGSIGIAVYPDDAVDSADLLRFADQAMFAAKKLGRNCCSYFTRSMQEETKRRMQLIRSLHQALFTDELAVHYQPIVELSTGRIHKAEALVRWSHPEHGLISPADFIPIAEDTGAIDVICDRVFQHSARLAKKWRAHFDPDFQISVNTSPVQFLADRLDPEDWLIYLRAIGLGGDGIAIEITEGVLLNPGANSKEKLLRFREAGIEVAIDDFGTGYSSLAYLKRFDIDYLKIDRSFISNLESDASNLALSEAIVVMAHKLGLKVIAEGVETEAQRAVLEKIGCDYAQGYLFAPPLPAEELEMLFERAPARDRLVQRSVGER